MSDSMLNNLTVLSPLLLLLLGGLVLMVVDALSKGKIAPALICVATFVSAGLTSIWLWLSVDLNFNEAIFSDYLASDKLSLFFDLIICGGGALSALLAAGYLKEHALERGEFYVLLLFSSFGAMALVRAIDLLSVFVGLETMSLAVYALVAFRRTSVRATEGALKYFLLGSFAAAVLLFGSGLLYGATGSTNLAEIHQVIVRGEANLYLLLLSFAFVLVGLAFKVGTVPFHVWAPDAYEGAVTPVTAFMSIVVKSAVFVVLIRVVLVAFGKTLLSNFYTGWPMLIAILSAATIVLGNISAVRQTNIKRMLAYSSIAHAGYILLGVCAAAKNPEATSAVLYYLLAYAVSSIAAFGSLILMGTRGKEAVSFEDIAGVGRRHPLAAVPFVVGLLSLMGFPPTAGFFGKYYVFTTAIQAGSDLLWLVILAALGSVVGAYYYLKVIVFLFMLEPQVGAPKAVPMKSGYVIVALIIACYFIFKIGVTPNRYLEMAIQAVS